MAEAARYKTVRQSRPLSLTVQLASKAGVSPQEARNALADAIGSISDQDIRSLNLKAGQLTVIL